MKHFLLALTGIMLSLIGQKSVNAQICGTYPEDHATLCLLRLSGAGQADTLETVMTRDGRFKFRHRPQEAGIYILAVPDAGRTYPMLLEPGESHIRIPDRKSIFIQSGELQKRIGVCNDKLQEVIRQQVATAKQLQQEKAPDRQKTLQEKAGRLEEQKKELFAQYIRDNKDNLAGVFLVWEKMEWTDFQELEKQFRLLDDKMQDTPAGNAIRKEIDRRWHLKPGVVARDFTMPDTAGNPVTLSDVRAKVKILDFWASWCIPCRAANKKFIALYEKYKGQGLEIIGISIDSNAKQWKKAVRQDGCNWIQLSELKNGEDALYRQYKVFGIPACFVLDENNRCIATGNNEEELEKTIRQILKHSSENL